MRTKRFRGSLSIVVVVPIFVVTLSPAPAKAKYVTAEIENVPIARLIRNLETRAAKNPRDAQVRFALARLHAMAYALKTSTAGVRKGEEDEGAWFGHEHKHVPFEVQATNNKNKLRVARRHLAKAIALYQQVLALEPGNLTAQLGHAWCVDQSGDKQKATSEYRKVIEAGWEKEKDLKSAGLGWNSVTAEAAGYLIPLLDQRADKEEITTLQARITRLGRVPRAVTPLIVPLRPGVGLSGLEDRTASVAFDADGTGFRKRWTWITPDAGWLVYDLNRTGQITSALQMFGSVTFWLFWRNAYESLAALDDDQNGMLSGDELDGFAIWRDLNRNGRCDLGEVKPLADWGIVSISCGYLLDDAKSHSAAHSPSGVSLRDGSSRPTYDLILRSAVSSVE